jgi:hypothetical protein
MRRAAATLAEGDANANPIVSQVIVNAVVRKALPAVQEQRLADIWQVRRGSETGLPRHDLLRPRTQPGS